MNKNDIIESLTRVLSTRREAKNAVETVFAEMRRSLVKGEKVVISKFGCFRVFTTLGKKGRNPKTGETIRIAPRRKVRFRQAKDLF